MINLMDDWKFHELRHDVLGVAFKWPHQTSDDLLTEFTDSDSLFFFFSSRSTDINHSAVPRSIGRNDFFTKRGPTVMHQEALFDVRRCYFLLPMIPNPPFFHRGSLTLCNTLHYHLFH